MIKISNFDASKEISSTYGYFSIGTIDTNYCGMCSFSNFECTCEIDGVSFKALLYRIGITPAYVVLSDFSSIPDIAVINNEEILEALKHDLIEYFRKTDLFLGDKAWWASSGNITWEGPTTTALNQKDAYVIVNPANTISSVTTKAY